MCYAHILSGVGGGWLVSLGFMVANCAPDLLSAFLSLWTAGQLPEPSACAYTCQPTHAA